MSYEKYIYYSNILGLFSIAEDSDNVSNTTSPDNVSNTTSQESLEELDALANHHVCLTQNFLLNSNYRIDFNQRPDI